MRATRVERPERLTIEVGRWSPSVTSVVVTVVFVLVVGMLANSVRTNNARAEDWHRRAVAAEEIVGGLRVVIADRSRALNRRTLQANELVARLDTSRGALRDTKVSVVALARRQRQLETQGARSETARRKLQARQAALASVASALNACSQGLAAVVPGSGKKKATVATRQARLVQCSRAQARYRAYLERTG